MKKVTAIFFFSIYLFSTTEAQQLFKLPVIFEHYREHKKEDHKISMLHFLAKHYLHGSPKDKDYNKDMQLPFKSSGYIISAVSAEYVPLCVQQDLPEPVVTGSQKPFIPKSRFILAAYLSNIWQPPKSC